MGGGRVPGHLGGRGHKKWRIPHVLNATKKKPKNTREKKGDENQDDVGEDSKTDRVKHNRKGTDTYSSFIARKYRDLETGGPRTTWSKRSDPTDEVFNEKKGRNA